jgi:hypothetical protein
MKSYIFIILLLITCFSRAQFREQIENRPSVHDGLIKNETPSMILGFINPNNFQMNHTYNLSYSMFGNQGLALGVYTNSMFYKFSDKLNIEVDASLVHSPYNTFGKDFTSQINGIYLSKAALNYKPWENFQINVQYNSYPMGSYYSPFDYRGSDFRRYDGWYMDR